MAADLEETKDIERQKSTKSFPKWLRYLLIGAGVFMTLLLAIMTSLYIFHPKFIYLPIALNAASEASLIQGLLAGFKDNPSGVSLSAPERIVYKSLDGTKLVSYWIPYHSVKAGEKLYTMIYCHGNQGKLDQQLLAIYQMQDFMPIHVMLVRYRGYGLSDGKPSKAGIEGDVQATMELLYGDGINSTPKSIRDLFDPTKVMIYGHSLGGAVAYYLLSQHLEKFKMAIIDSTFSSLKRATSDRKPYLLPFFFLAYRNNWDNLKASEEIKRKVEEQKVKMPHILMISGAKDRLILPKHTDALFDKLKTINIPSSTIIRKVQLPNAGHECFYDVEFYEHVARFFAAAK